MAKIKKILYNGLYILPETVTDAVLDNNMERTLTEMLDDKLSAAEDDTAQGKITFAGGAVTDHLASSTYTSGFGGKGYELKMEGGESQLTIDKAVIRDDAQIGGDATISGNASVGGQLTTDNITSSDYNGEFTGFTLKDTDGGSYLEVDKLNVRKKAVFRELDIKKIDHIGGANVTSPASCKIDAVDLNFPAVDLIDANGKKFYAADGEFLVLSDIADGYKCYFNATDGDKVIHNEWKVGDQALCHAFNLTTPRYYWRLVTAVSVEPIDGFHCVVLSMSDCDTDSDVPMAEDTIVCFGNRTDKDRQSVIIMDSEGASAPYLRQLKGISTYRVDESNVVTLLSPTKNIIKGHQIVMVSEDGEKDVAAEFRVQSDMISSVVESTSNEFGAVRSEITQTADNIRLQVGNAGINLGNQNITLTASKTTINGDLAVGVVKCYYDDAKTQLRSAYNGNGDGTIVYYYPNGQVMRQDAFVTDTSGNVLGMRTTYYKADGSVAWVLSEGGIQTTLDYYWEAINGGNALAYTDSVDTMMEMCKQYLDTAMQHFSRSQFSRFVTQNNYKDYNGKVAKGLKSSEKPDSVALYSGVLVYSIELVKDGAMPVYQVNYEQVTTKLNQLSPIKRFKRFNSLGEIN